MSKGWVKIHRETLLNPIVCKDTDYFAIWCYLLLKATHSKIPKIFKGKKIDVNPGQLITGRKSISNHFGGNNKISESKIQRILKTFENEQMIEQQTSNKNRLVTILNWTRYQLNEQHNEQPVNNKRTTDEQPVNTNNKDKNLKNDKNIKNKEKKKLPPKTLYLEFVLLTDNEYSKLVELLKKHVDYYIESLNNYIGSKNKKYESHYFTIRQWYSRDKKDYEEKSKGKNLLPKDIESDWLDDYIKNIK